MVLVQADGRQPWALQCVLLPLGPCPAVTCKRQMQLGHWVSARSESGAAAERMLQSRWLFFIETDGGDSKKSGVAGLCQAVGSIPHGRSQPSV